MLHTQADPRAAPTSIGLICVPCAVGRGRDPLAVASVRVVKGEGLKYLGFETVKRKIPCLLNPVPSRSQSWMTADATERLKGGAS